MSNLPELLHEAEAVLTVVGLMDHVLRLVQRLMLPGTGRHRRPRS